jgi:acyl-CoA oxidase
MDEDQDEDEDVLGVFNGHVYEALWQRVQMKLMNKDEVTPAYAVRCSPMLEINERFC